MCINERRASPQVCELDIIFNFEKAYFILDEFLLGGEIQETSKQIVARCIEASDMLQEVRDAHAHTCTHNTHMARHDPASVVGVALIYNEWISDCVSLIGFILWVGYVSLDYIFGVHRSVKKVQMPKNEWFIHLLFFFFFNSWTKSICFHFIFQLRFDFCWSLNMTESVAN